MFAKPQHRVKAYITGGVTYDTRTEPILPSSKALGARTFGQQSRQAEHQAECQNTLPTPKASGNGFASRDVSTFGRGGGVQGAAGKGAESWDGFKSFAQQLKAFQRHLDKGRAPQAFGEPRIGESEVAPTSLPGVG